MQSGLRERQHADGTVNLSSLEEGIPRPASSALSGFTAANDGPLFHSSLRRAPTTPGSARGRERATLFRSLPPLERTPIALTRARQGEDDTMGGEASEDDEPPPTYVSN